MTQSAVASDRAVNEERPVIRSVNPADGELIAVFPAMGDVEIEAVVGRARRAAEWWSGRPDSVRRACLLRWAARLVARTDELADLVHREQGKPIDEAFLEIVPALEQIRWAARNAGRVLNRRRVWAGLTMSNYLAEVDYRPFGVVGVIGPWNNPVFTPAGSIGYALAAGNTVVFKPSEYTPATGAFLMQAFADANPDVPGGVLSLITGDGTAGAGLIRAHVDKIAFTGSPRTGKAVMRAAADKLIPVVLECGGKDPMIVADDADVTAAAKIAVWGGMFNSGQTCIGIERVYVTESVRKRFLDEVRRLLNGVHPGTAYGPMTTPEQVNIVRRHITEAVAAGAEIVVGSPDAAQTAFIEPVVLADTPDHCSAITEETFGPVLTVQTVANIEEAISRANSLPYALGASVFSRRSGRQIAERIRGGMVAVNCGLAFVGIPALPFGGQGESGFGRIHGDDGLREFAQPHSYVRQIYSVAGMDVATLSPHPRTIRILKSLMKVRHFRPPGRR